MNEEHTKMMAIALVFLIGMVSATAFILSTDDHSNDSERKNVHENQLPMASMFPSTTLTTPGGSIVFDASSSEDPDGTIVSYHFDFGDGSMAVWQASPLVEHTYVDIGDYTVTLVVQDSNDTRSENSMIVVISVREQSMEDVITTSSRSMNDFSEAYETVENSPYSDQPEEEDPSQQVQDDQPDFDVPDLPYEETQDLPVFPDTSSMEFEDPEMNLGFDDLGNKNAGYEAAQEWENEGEEFAKNVDEDVFSLDLDKLEDDQVELFTTEYGTFKEKKDTQDTAKAYNYRTLHTVNVTTVDTNKDGKPEMVHTQTAAYEAIGRQTNPRYESLYSSEVRTFDNNSDGIKNYIRINQFGYESVDKDGDGNPEYSLVSVRVVVSYDNNSDGNAEFAKVLEVTFVRVDKNDDGHAEFQAAHFGNVMLWDENSDGNVKLLMATEWGVSSIDTNNNSRNEYASVNGKKIVIFDNSSNGKPDYARYTNYGIVSKDKNDDGENELMMVAYEDWIIRDNKDGNSDGKPEVIRGSKVYFRHNSVRNLSAASFEHVVLFDNSSDGVHNHIHYSKAAWASIDNNSDGNREFEGIRLEDLVIYKNNTSNDNTSYVKAWTFTGAKWDGDSDGTPNHVHYKAEAYVKQDEDQDGEAEVEWHVKYEGNGR